MFGATTFFLFFGMAWQNSGAVRVARARSLVSPSPGGQGNRIWESKGEQNGIVFGTSRREKAAILSLFMHMRFPCPGGGGSRTAGARGGVRGGAGIRSALRALSPQPAALRAATVPLQGKVTSAAWTTGLNPVVARGRETNRWENDSMIVG